MFVGARNKLYIGVESEFGTGSTTDIKYLLPAKSFSPSRKIEAVKSEALLGYRGTKTLAPGKEGVEGSMDVELYPSTSGILFYLGLGKRTQVASLSETEIFTGDGSTTAFALAHTPDTLTVTLDGTTQTEGIDYTLNGNVIEFVTAPAAGSIIKAAYSYTVTANKITPIGLGEELPSFVAYENINGEKHLLHKGLKANQLKLDLSVGAIPSVSIDMVGKEEEILASEPTLSSITNPDDEPFYFKEVTVMKPFVSDEDVFVPAIDYAKIELTINNNLDTDDYRFDGTGKRYSIPAQQLEVTGSIDIIFDASSFDYEYAKYYNFEDFKLRMKLQKANDSSKVIEIVLPRIKFSEATFETGGPDKMTMSASFTALIPSSGDIIEVYDFINTSDY